MVSFDTNILVYATILAPLAKTHRARDLLVRGMRTGSCILLLQTLAEFSSVAIRKAGIAVDEVRTTIDAWRAVLPVQGTEDDDLSAALDAVKKHPNISSDNIRISTLRFEMQSVPAPFSTNPGGYRRAVRTTGP
jgi:predicted nucleic acid-binding protein